MNAFQLLNEIVKNAPVETPDAPPTTIPHKVPAPTRPTPAPHRPARPNPFRRKHIHPGTAPRPKACDGR